VLDQQARGVEAVVSSLVCSSVMSSLVSALRECGWPGTRLVAEGLHGEAALLLLVLDDSRLPARRSDLDRHAPHAFWSIERLQMAKVPKLHADHHETATASRIAIQTGSGHQR